MEDRLVPAYTSQEIKDKYVSDIGAWKNFAQRITKNRFVKNFLLQRDGNNCSWCQGSFKDNIIIHHTTYDHRCSFNVLIQVDALTTKRPNRLRIVPDCESCKKDNNKRFLTCMNKLVLVHGLCNERIAHVSHFGR